MRRVVANRIIKRLIKIIFSDKCSVQFTSRRSHRHGAACWIGQIRICKPTEKLTRLIGFIFQRINGLPGTRAHNGILHSINKICYGIFVCLPFCDKRNVRIDHGKRYVFAVFICPSAESIPLPRRGICGQVQGAAFFHNKLADIHISAAKLKSDRILLWGACKKRRRANGYQQNEYKYYGFLFHCKFIISHARSKVNHTDFFSDLSTANRSEIRISFT